MGKIIFLDFDGVMMCTKHAFPSPHHEGFEFYPKSVENLKELIQLTGAKIVVTSTYRRMADSNHLKERFLAPYNLDKDFMGITPSTKDGRGHEIRTYIETHLVENFVIFDDLSIQGFGDHFFRIHPFEGITQPIMTSAAKLLNGIGRE